MKKFSILILLTLLLITAISGCKNSDDTKSGSNVVESNINSSDLSLSDPSVSSTNPSSTTTPNTQTSSESESKDKGKLSAAEEKALKDKMNSYLDELDSVGD